MSLIPHVESTLCLCLLPQIGWTDTDVDTDIQQQYPQVLSASFLLPVPSCESQCQLYFLINLIYEIDLIMNARKEGRHEILSLMAKKCLFVFFLSVGTGLKEQLTQAGPMQGFEVCPYFFVIPPHSSLQPTSTVSPSNGLLPNLLLLFSKTKYVFIIPKTLYFPFSSP